MTQQPVYHDIARARSATPISRDWVIALYQQSGSDDPISKQPADVFALLIPTDLAAKVDFAALDAALAARQNPSFIAQEGGEYVRLNEAGTAYELNELPLASESEFGLARIATLTEVNDGSSSQIAVPPQHIRTDLVNASQSGTQVTLTRRNGTTITINLPDVADWAIDGDPSLIPEGKIPATIARDSELPSASQLVASGGADKQVYTRTPTGYAWETPLGEANVNADWDATSGDAEILNKPTIPAATPENRLLPTPLGSAGQVTKVNSSGDGVEWADDETGGGGGGGATNLSVSRTGSAVTIASDTGSDAVIMPATGVNAGIFPAADKSKLDGIQSGAEQNVQADWNENDNTADAYIQNKPSDDRLLPTPLGTSGQVPVVNAMQDGVEWGNVSGGGGGGATNLGFTRDADSVVITSSTGSNADIPAASRDNAGVMSAADKTKVDGVTAGAEPNVQADWGETTTTDDAYIRDKPSLAQSISRGTTGVTIGVGGGTTDEIGPADASNAGVMSRDQAVKLAGIDAGAEVNVQADWNATSGDAAIRNKPTIPMPANAVPVQSGASGAIGVSARYARQDHRHQGDGTGAGGGADLADTTDATSRDTLTAGTQGSSTEAARATHTHQAAQASVSATEHAAGVTIAVNGGSDEIGPATRNAAGAMSRDDKSKLDGIAAGAEVNVQADWNESTTTDDAFILNKPSIPQPANTTPVQSAASGDIGSSARYARADHRHQGDGGGGGGGANLAASGGATTRDILTAGSQGSDTTAARAGHSHQAVAAATQSVDGLMASADKTKLDGIAAGAEVNVQADWDAATGDAAILNKPTIPAAPAAARLLPTPLGTAGQIAAVNAGATATEFVDAPTGVIAGGTDGQVYKRTATGYEWADEAGGGTEGAGTFSYESLYSDTTTRSVSGSFVAIGNLARSLAAADDDKLLLFTALALGGRLTAVARAADFRAGERWVYTTDSNQRVLIIAINPSNNAVSIQQIGTGSLSLNGLNIDLITPMGAQGERGEAGPAGASGFGRENLLNRINLTASTRYEPTANTWGELPAEWAFSRELTAADDDKIMEFQFQTGHYDTAVWPVWNRPIQIRAGFWRESAAVANGNPGRGIGKSNLFYVVRGDTDPQSSNAGIAKGPNGRITAWMWGGRNNEIEIYGIRVDLIGATGTGGGTTPPAQAHDVWLTSVVSGATPTAADFTGANAAMITTGQDLTLPNSLPAGQRVNRDVIVAIPADETLSRVSLQTNPVQALSFGAQTGVAITISGESAKWYRLTPMVWAGALNNQTYRVEIA